MKAAEELEHLSSVVTRSFLNKSCEENYDFSLTPEHKHFPLHMFPDFTVQPYLNSALLSPKQNRRGQAGVETRREFKMFICLLKKGEKGKHQSVWAEILLWCLGIMKLKTWVARMFFIAACTPVQRVRLVCVAAAVDMFLSP